MTQHIRCSPGPCTYPRRAVLSGQAGCPGKGHLHSTWDKGRSCWWEPQAGPSADLVQPGAERVNTLLHTSVCVYVCWEEDSP